MLKKGDRVGIVCCSDGLPSEKKGQIKLLEEKLGQLGLQAEQSPYLYRGERLAAASSKDRAAVLMDMYRDPGIRAVMDVSGGNLANQILEYLDYEVIRDSKKEFWGYSDLTTVLNGIYTKTGNSGWLYQIRNLTGSFGKEQRRRFEETGLEGGTELYPDSWQFLRGTFMEGVVIGGNIRCFLKLAGTEYFPPLENKILFLEGFGGGRGVIASLMTQLRQMGVFEKIHGLLLGTFTQLDREEGFAAVEQLAFEAADRKDLPVARTRQAGHGEDSRAIHLGTQIRLGKWG